MIVRKFLKKLKFDTTIRSAICAARRQANAACAGKIAPTIIAAGEFGEW
jgi:hypothetical protein